MYRFSVSPLHAIARFFTLLVSAYFLQTCTPRQDVATPPVTLPTTPNEVQPYQLVPFTPANIEYKSEKYAATFGNQPITLVRHNKNLLWVVPEIAAGKQTLRVDIDGKIYEQLYTVSVGQVITPTQAKQLAQTELTKEEEYAKQLDTYLSNTPNLRLFVQAKTVAKLKQANADFRKALESATDADLVILAKFLTANNLLTANFESLKNGRQTAGEDAEFQLFDSWFTKINADLLGKLAKVTGVSIGVGVFFTPLAGVLVFSALVSVVMSNWVDQKAGFIQKGAAVIIEDGPPALESRSAVDPKDSPRFNKATDWPNDVATEVSFKAKRRTWWDKRFSGRAMYNKMMKNYALLQEAYELLVSFIGDIEPVVDLAFLETKEVLATASAAYFKTGRLSNPNVTIKKQVIEGEKLILTLASSVTATDQPFLLSMDYERVDGDVLTTVVSGTVVTNMPTPSDIELLDQTVEKLYYCPLPPLNKSYVTVVKQKIRIKGPPDVYFGKFFWKTFIRAQKLNGFYNTTSQQYSANPDNATCSYCNKNYQALLWEKQTDGSYVTTLRMYAGGVSGLEPKCTTCGTEKGTANFRIEVYVPDPSIPTRERQLSQTDGKQFDWESCFGL